MYIGYDNYHSRYLWGGGGVILFDGLGPFFESYGLGPFFESYTE